MTLVSVALVGAVTLDRLGGDQQVPAGIEPLVTQSHAVAAGTQPPARISWPPRSPDLSVVPELMRIDMRPNGRHLFVHGDVFSLEAFIVVVSLEDRGVVTDTVTVSMPGGSTAFLTDANPRFHARFDMPDAAPIGSIWVRANAYDTHGDLILSLRQAVL